MHRRSSQSVNMLTNIKISTVCFFVLSTVYFTVSKILFETVYLTSNLVVDEEFHLPLGETYCKFRFDKWDSKVTTLPGLYIVSALVLGPFNLCSIYGLRLISLGCSVINLFLFYVLLSKYAEGDWRNIISALTLSLLPPLYFLSHLYYTDMVSLTMILCMMVLSERGNHYMSSIFGFFAVICRQTNIITVGIYAGKYLLTELYAVWIGKEHILKKEGRLPQKNFIPFLKAVATTPFSILEKTSASFWLNMAAYLSLVISFLLFVIWNGSIVVGDRAAHEASIHIPQIFYFSLFSLIFGWPHFVGDVLKFIIFAKKHKLLVLFSIIVGILIVHVNTQVHPYLLADNRHFTFYIWNRFYGRYWWFRYAIVPVYIFGLYSIVKKVWDRNDISFALMYLPAMAVLLVTQKLIEIRYFIVPYVLMRLRFRNTNSTVFNVVLEFVTFCIMNMITFNIFFTKTVKWIDWEYPQRIMW